MSNTRVCVPHLYPRKIIWGSKIQQCPRDVPFADVMAQDDHGLYKWLLNVVSVFNECVSFMINISQHKFGFSFVSGVPTTPEATEELSQRIGFIRETQCQSF